LGLGLIVLLEILNKTIRRPAELVQLFQAQPLATVPYIWTASEMRTGGNLMSIRLAFDKVIGGLSGSKIT